MHSAAAHSAEKGLCWQALMAQRDALVEGRARKILAFKKRGGSKPAGAAFAKSKPIKCGFFSPLRRSFFCATLAWGLLFAHYFCGSKMGWTRQCSAPCFEHCRQAKFSTDYSFQAVEYGLRERDISRLCRCTRTYHTPLDDSNGGLAPTVTIRVPQS